VCPRTNTAHQLGDSRRDESLYAPLSTKLIVFCKQAIGKPGSLLAQGACLRVTGGFRTPGVVEISRDVPVEQAIEELLLLAERALHEEIEERVLYLPL